MKVIALFLLLIQPGCLSLFAQTHAYRFSRITSNDGLSHNQVKTVFKDRRGFLWVGTISGLNRYDGYSVKVFANEPGDTTSMISSDVNNVFEDPGGRLWIHTWSGTNVYDPLTERFDRNTDRILQKFSIPPGMINDIIRDSRSNFWFIHDTQGLFRYSARDKRTIRLSHMPGDLSGIATNEVSSVAEDHHGNIWVLHTNGILEKLDPSTLEVISRNDALNKRFRNQVLEYKFMIDRDGDLWFYIGNHNSGVFHFRPDTQQWSHIDNTTTKPRLNTSIVKGIVQDDAGMLWIATDHGGINLLDKSDLSVKYILHNPEDEKSLGQNSINVLYKDADGIIWAGTFKNGVSFYHKNINRFQLHKHQVSNRQSLPFNDINAIVEDQHGNLWIGTNGGGLIYFDRVRNTYKQYLHDRYDKNSLSTNVIVSLLIDRDNTLWIGTYFGGLLSFDGRNFVRYKHDPDDPKSISDNSIWELFEDSQGNLWIGTLSQGVDMLDRDRKEFRHFNMHSPNPIHASYIPAFMEDSQGNLWVGTGYGIDVLERTTGRFAHFRHRANDKGSLSNNSVLAMYEDSRGLIWVATHGGLNLYDRVSRQFSVFTKEDGLPHNSVLTILEDRQRNLWVSTAYGLSNLRIRYDPGSRDSLSIQFRNYDERDGLQGMQFNENAACKTAAGELVFAGGNGFNLFKPEDIGVNRKVPSVTLTDFQIFNKSIRPLEIVEEKTVLEESISSTDTIELDHSDNVFSIEFASLSQFHPDKTQYQYILEGFDKKWTRTEASQRRVTYTNLDPGHYLFKVKASNNDGIWNEEPTELMIVVRPPFWKSRTAFVLYALATLMALLLARWLILYNERIRFQIQQERDKAQRIRELDRLKTKFFTNISHEFRTPLTLIIAPLEKIVRTTPEGEQRTQLQMIHRNARRLLSLVNQLLDFRKMEVQEPKLNTSQGDIVYFIREVSHSFSDLSEKNNIRFSFHTSVQQLETVFDQDKLEKILFNLLSNAFKFTPENGSVSVSLDVRQSADTAFLDIHVSDTGIGIPQDQQERIFERFFQHDLPKTLVNQGTGIGLSITKEFVKVHGGSIKVKSEPGKGSCFTVSLPLIPLSSRHAVAPTEAPFIVAEENVPAGNGRRPVVLIVEDNEDFRFYLKDNLRTLYGIEEARNGREGFDRAISCVPDLIVTDVMMPEVNGIELCKKIREDQRTCHIPVVMLTARTAEEQKIEGFACGANDYVTKPFNFEILHARIKNLIAQRESLHKKFRKQVKVRATDIEITSMDEKLISKAVRIVEQNIGEPDFSVEKFSRELGMSRVHLYKKLLALTGKTPIEFIRAIRLQRAAQLLEKSQLSVAEIAYQVGFNNPKYFSKYFKDHFNMLPSSYAHGNK